MLVTESQWRADALKSIGLVNFTVIPSNVNEDEIDVGQSPDEFALGTTEYVKFKWFSFTNRNSNQESLCSEVNNRS